MEKAICQKGPWCVSMGPCCHEEPVSTISATGGRPFFYLYGTLHLKLGVKLPFTHFEQVVLRVLNVAPTQLHPNNWAFVRAFELLCEDLGQAPSLGYSTQALRELRKKKEALLNVQPSPPGAEAVPLSAAKPEDNPPDNPRNDFQDHPQDALAESAERPRKRPHLRNSASAATNGQVGDQCLSILTKRPSDPSIWTSSFPFGPPADQGLASSSLGHEVKRLGMTETCGIMQKYAAYNLILARAVEKEFGLLEAQNQSWADRFKKSEEDMLSLSTAYSEAKVKINNYRATTVKL
ncbi:hypothetical protein CR513_21027, partial [Mucuna pruriens]